MSTEKPVNRWAAAGPLSRMRELDVVWMFVKRSLLMQTRFKFAYSMGLAQTASSLVIYGIIASLGRSIPGIGHLPGGYITWVISGLVLNLLLNTAIAGPHEALIDSYWSSRLEMILSSPLRLPVFVTGMSAGRYVDALISIAIYLVGGTIFLGFAWPSAPGILAFLAVLIPAMVACTGLGLAAASSMYTLDARDGEDPIRFAVTTVSGLVAGVYFPLQVLPGWVQWAALLIPHTYALDGIRRALYGERAIPLLPVHHYLPLAPLVADALILLIYALIAIPLGWRLFRYGLDLARTDGRLSRWL